MLAGWQYISLQIIRSFVTTGITGHQCKFGFCKMWLKCWNLCLLHKCFLMSYIVLKFFPQIWQCQLVLCDFPWRNYLQGIVNVERIWRHLTMHCPESSFLYGKSHKTSYHCHIWEKEFNTIYYITNICKKTTLDLFFPSQRFPHFIHILQNPIYTDDQLFQ